MMRVFSDQGFGLPIPQKSEWLMTVSAFFDESGKFKDKKVICFGGVVSFAEHFNDFGIEWRRLLRLNGLKSLHATEAFKHRRPLSKKNQNTGLNKRINDLLPFVSCIRKYLLAVVGIAVDVRGFKELPSHFFQFYGNDPIYMAFARMALQVMEFAPDSDQISMIVDEDEETTLPFYRLYKRVKKVWPGARNKLVGLSFVDDKYLFALQASDLVAGLIRREMAWKVAKEKNQYRKLFRALIKSPEKHERLWFAGVALGTKDQLVEMAEQLRETWNKMQEEQAAKS
jgi:hypothetical protein